MGMSGHRGLGSEGKKGNGCSYKRLVRAFGGNDMGVLGISMSISSYNIVLQFYSFIIREN